MKKIKGSSGILFIGDPHLWSKKPSRRLDDNFTSVVLNKIENAINIANDNNLVPIILGDLFHVDDECDIDMLTKLSRILSKSKFRCATVEGNHEKKQTKLHDGSALSLLRDTNMIDVYESNGFASLLNIGGKNILVGSTPYGAKIPTEVNLPKNENIDFTIWLTHANLDFGETYPGVIPVTEIKNVDMLVNGHIHKTRPKVKVGNMVAFNPGNITRLSVDCSNHKPSVWKWIPENRAELEQIEIEYRKDVFDTSDHLYHYEPNKIEEAKEITSAHSSQFVQHMQKQLLEGADLSDDGGYIKESINALAFAMNVSEEIKTDMLSLVEEVLKEVK